MLTSPALEWTMISAEDEVMVNCIGRTRHDLQWRYATPLAMPMTRSILSYSSLVLMYSFKRHIAKGSPCRKADTAISCVPFIIHNVITEEICRTWRQYWRLTTERGYHVSISPTLLETWGAARWKRKYYLRAQSLVYVHLQNSVARMHSWVLWK